MKAKFNRNCVKYFTFETVGKNTGQAKPLHIQARQENRKTPTRRTATGRGKNHARRFLDIHAAGHTTGRYSNETGRRAECGLDVSLRPHYRRHSGAEMPAVT